MIQKGQRSGYMNTLNNIIMYYNCSEPESTYHNMLGKILQNLHQFQDCTVYDISELCAVAPATVGRLARKLGYQNFADMKNSISSSIRNMDYSNRLLPVQQSTSPERVIASYTDVLRKMLDEFEDTANIQKYIKIANRLHKSHKVRLYNMTMDFPDYCLQLNLIAEQKDTLMVCGYSNQLEDSKSLDENSFVIVHFWAGADNMDMRPIFKRIADAGACCLIITGTDSSIPIGHDSDFALCGAKADGNIMMGGTMNTYHMEILNTFYRLMYIDKVWDETGAPKGN